MNSIVPWLALFIATISLGLHIYKFWIERKQSMPIFEIDLEKSNNINDIALHISIKNQRLWDISVKSIDIEPIDNVETNILWIHSETEPDNKAMMFGSLPVNGDIRIGPGKKATLSILVTGELIEDRKLLVGWRDGGSHPKMRRQPLLVSRRFLRPGTASIDDLLDRHPNRQSDVKFF